MDPDQIAPKEPNSMQSLLTLEELKVVAMVLVVSMIKTAIVHIL